MIDFGGEELGVDEGLIVIYGAFESFGSLQSFIEEKGLEVDSSGFERIPTMTKELTEDQIADVEKLIERMEEDDDVNQVFTTMA